jgi:hypothetical protein
MAKKSMENMGEEPKVSDPELFESAETTEESILHVESEKKETEVIETSEPTEKNEITSLQDLLDQVPSKDLSNEVFEKGKLKLDNGLKNELHAQLTNRIYDIFEAAQKKWYYNNKEELSKQGFFSDGADEASIVGVFNRGNGMEKLLQDKDLMGKIERYGKLKEEIQKPELDELGYMSLINEVKKIIAENNLAPELKNSALFRLRQGDLINTAAKLIENLTGRNLKKEGEDKFPAKTLEESTSPEAVKNRFEFIMNEYGNPEQLDKILIESYGWTKEFVRNGLSKNIVYKNEKGEVMKEITPNFLGAYDKDKTDKEIEEMLNDRIKEDLAKNYNEQERDKEKQIDGYVLSNVLEFNSDSLKNNIVDEAIKSAPEMPKESSSEFNGYADKIGKISPEEVERWNLVYKNKEKLELNKADKELIDQLEFLSDKKGGPKGPAAWEREVEIKGPFSR